MKIMEERLFLFSKKSISLIKNEKFNIFIEEKYQLSKKTKILDTEDEEKQDEQSTD